MTTPAQHNWMIYGANGFTGKLIAAEATRRGMKPTLAGRNKEQLAALAAELELEYRAFPIESVEQFANKLEGYTVLLNCAGPFTPSADIVVQACIAKGVHYLDISGEPEMMEQHFSRHQQALTAGVMVVPAVGFDVVPSDALANLLAERMPDATDLELAFFGDGSGSAGSAKTVMGMMADKGRVRRKGKIIKVPLGYKRKPIQFSDREEWCMSTAWGDVCTAYHSTGIPNITVFMPTPEKAGRMMRLLSPLAPLLSLPPIRQKLFAKIDAGDAGPDADTRANSVMRLWGKVANAKGESLEATMNTQEGFTLTTNSSLACVEKILNGEVNAGCLTATQAFGTDLALSLPGTEVQW